MNSIQDIRLIENQIQAFFAWFYSQDYITIKDGNACAQLDPDPRDGRFLVTKSGVDKDYLESEDFTVVHYELAHNELSGGVTTASIETMAHIHAINATGKKCSVHVHSPNTVALFGLCEKNPELLEDLEYSLNKKWPELFRYTKVGQTVPFLSPGSDALHDAIKKSFQLDADIIVLQNHGVIAVGNSIKLCQEHIVRLEHICKILLKRAQVVPSVLKDIL